MKIKLWMIAILLFIAGLTLSIITNDLFINLFLLGLLLIVSSLILIIISVRKLKKRISIPVIILTSIVIIFILMFSFVSWIMNRDGHWACEPTFICVLPTTNIPCTSEMDCGMRPLLSICNATTSTCSNYSDSTIPNRKECTAAGGSWQKTTCYIF